MASEQSLTLPDGRTLAYEEIGDKNSHIVVVFIHGVLGVGSATRLSPALQDVHFIAPTVPGWGNSSPRPKSTPFTTGFLSDMTALIKHAHPDDTNMRLYISGGSYGTALAQIIYGAPFDAFPYGRNIVGCLLLAPFSPFRLDKNFGKSMSWKSWFGVGPRLPFHIIPNLVKFIISSKCKTVDQMESFIQDTLFAHASDQERENFKKWKQEQGFADGQWERRMAENAMKSVSKSWEGWLEVADVLHSDWGFIPDELDEEHSKRPVWIVPSTQDELGHHMADWLGAHYKNSKVRWIDGGHIASLYMLDEIWKELRAEVEEDIST